MILRALDRARHRIPFWWWLTYDALVALVIVLGIAPGDPAFVLGFAVLGVAVAIDTVEFVVKSPWARRRLAPPMGSSGYARVALRNGDSLGNSVTFPSATAFGGAGAAITYGAVVKDRGIEDDPEAIVAAFPLIRSAVPGTAVGSRLHAAKDALGWRPPWHYHYRIVDGDGPPRAENCPASECEAPGCPRTYSGFPEDAPL